MVNPDAYITPSVLRWARETIGYSIDQVVAKLGRVRVTAETVGQWEAGEARPSYAQFQRLAEFYKRPTAIFYLSEPPEEEPLESNFRSLPVQYVRALPPKVRYLIRLARVRQLELAELLDGKRPPRLARLARLRHGDIRTVAKVAIATRRLLGISLAEQKGWPTADIAFERWRDRLTEHGLWVFKASFGSEASEYDGFFLPDRDYPVIYINNNKAKRRQIFTLWHEVGHFMLAKGGISFRDNHEQKLRGAYLKDEVYCNAFASEFLVPSADLDLDKMPEAKVVRALADQYKVSEEVILRKCLDYKFIDWDGYRRRISRTGLSDKVASRGGGGDYYRNQRACLGVRYLKLAFEQYHQEQISEAELAEYVGVKRSQLSRLEETIYQDARPASWH